jgi:transglutaminase-like putative cysteine protease
MIRYVIAAVGLLTLLCPWAAAQDDTQYLAALINGKKVGYAVHTRSVAADKVTTNDDVSLTISRVGIAITIKMTEKSIETAAGKPLGFESVQLLGGVSMRVSGVVEPNGAVSVVSSSMGQESKSTMPWPAGAIMSEGLRLLSMQKGLKTGTQYTASVFSPSLMQALEAKVTIGVKKPVDLLGRVVTLTETTTRMSVPGAGDVNNVSYVDDNVEALRTITPIAGMQVELVSCTPEFAMGKVDAVELIGNMFVKSPTRLSDLGSVRSITYTLVPTTDANFVIPTTDNQRVARQQEGKILLTIEPVAAATGGIFPYKGNDPKLLEALKPTVYLQCDRKEIVDLAHQAVGDAKDAAEAARRIESFVGKYIENRSMSVGYASAAEVAASRQGDCSEFAVLTAALCRAVGIPAQVVVGVAYVSEFAGQEGFGGHAWDQAYIQGKWVGLDAAFKGGGRGGYDAGHIALAVGNGDPGDFFNIATALGRFKIEKLTVQKKP